MSIYHWKLGDIALAKICKKVYAKVQVVKDEKGLFYDDKVLGISANENGTIKVTKELCYYIEISRTKERLWVPYTSLHLAARSRPFYGPADKVSPAPKQISTTPRKRKIKEDHIVPLNVKLNKYKTPDLNTTYDVRHTPLKQGKYENAFKEFVRQGTEMIFDEFYLHLKNNHNSNEDCLDYLANVDASTEDKFELVIKNIVTLKEIENYLHQCWKYNFIHKQMENRDGPESSNPTSPEKSPITLHAPWCLVCGKGDKLRQCPNCPSSFHPVCRREWLITIIHRKNPPKKTQTKVTLVEKILSSTRTKCSIQKENDNLVLCPSCMWGPRVGYDDVVWHKLGSCPWWPARVLPPGAVPSCLLARTHQPHHWPLKYYGTNNHSWGDGNRMCLFLPSHTAALDSGKDPMLQQAVLDACDDYIAVYLK
ncbi:uncharacterized protein LOC113511192 [Galleria mellonella]|uniref:Uncharacterized protein LOC113511192 n=1 Tax=Galleria mellonella TaxID=7137 RepID=A0A6J1WB88_GALME|nr:uncharacterized protein LOC113511192 [Galleria mellonella]